MACGKCGATRPVNTVAKVNTGCDKIDEGLEYFNDAKSYINKAVGYLSYNNLQFGGAAANLDEALAMLTAHIDKSISANEGLTDAIRSAATKQQQTWDAHVTTCLKDEDDD